MKRTSSIRRAALAAAALAALTAGTVGIGGTEAGAASARGHAAIHAPAKSPSPTTLSARSIRW